MEALRLALLLLLIAATNAEISNFDYSSHGDDWGESDPLWEDCASDTQQSPIEIADGIKSTNDSYLFASFKPEKAIVSFLNTTIYFKTTSSALYFGEVYTKTVMGNTAAYKTTEVRMRCHSEHKIYGKYYDLELQVFSTEIYPSSKNDKVAFSLMFEVGDKADPVLQLLMDNYKPEANYTTSIDLSHLLNNAKPFDYWFYLGSPTIPPCRIRTMNWIISKRVFSMSQKQRDFFYTLFNNDQMDGNWRKLQSIKDNPVSFYQLAFQ